MRDKLIPPVPEVRELPSAGAYEAAIIAYNEGGQDWVKQKLLDIHRQNSKLGRQILNIANQIDQKEVSPIAAFYISMTLWEDALDREYSGSTLDSVYQIDDTRF